MTVSTLSTAAPRCPRPMPIMTSVQTTTMKFDSNGIYASNDFLASIAADYLKQEKREREQRRSLTDEDLSGQWGVWNISDRD